MAGHGPSGDRGHFGPVPGGPGARRGHAISRVAVYSLLPGRDLVVGQAPVRSGRPGRRHGISGRRHQGGRHRVDLLGCRRLPGGLGDRAAACLSGAQLRSALDQFRSPAAAPYLGRDLRLRRQHPLVHLLLCRPADLSRAPGRGSRPLVRVLGLSALHRAGGDRLSAWRDPVQGICRAGVVHGPLADAGVGGLPAGFPRHPLEARGAAYLCRQLVLPRLHRDRGDASCGEQPGTSGLSGEHQELYPISPACRMP